MALALLPALIAAAYSIASAVLASLSTARRAALRDSLQGSAADALSRYLQSPARIEARWLLLRVIGIATTAALFSVSLRGVALPWLLGALTSLLVYAVPSELGRQYASKRAEQLAPTLLRLLRPLEWFVAPIADPLSWLAMRVAGPESNRPPSSTLTETEVELIVNEGELNGSLAHDQSEMIRNVLDFGECTAEEVMVPRIHVDALDQDASIVEVLAAVRSTQHSRYPVYADTVDNIVGILHVKDLMSAVAEQRLEQLTLQELARKPVAFVPEGQRATTVLKDMRAGRHHMAVVIDEFGGFAGVVTLEDLLEEIVGDIQDEHDLEDDARIRMIGDDKALVDASLPITDINRQLGTDLPEGDYVSLGGLILEHIGQVPAPGAQHELLGLHVTIKDADARHIALVELADLPSPPSGPGGDPKASAA